MKTSKRNDLREPQAESFIRKGGSWFGAGGGKRVKERECGQQPGYTGDTGTQKRPPQSELAAASPGAAILEAGLLPPLNRYRN